MLPELDSFVGIEPDNGKPRPVWECSYLRDTALVLVRHAAMLCYGPGVQGCSCLGDDIIDIGPSPGP